MGNNKAAVIVSTGQQEQVKEIIEYANEKIMDALDIVNDEVLKEEKRCRKPFVKDTAKYCFVLFMVCLFAGYGLSRHLWVLVAVCGILNILAFAAYCQRFADDYNKYAVDRHRIVEQKVAPYMQVIMDQIAQKYSAAQEPGHSDVKASWEMCCGSPRVKQLTYNGVTYWNKPGGRLQIVR